MSVFRREAGVESRQSQPISRTTLTATASPQTGIGVAPFGVHPAEIGRPASPALADGFRDRVRTVA
jgi:hypothetical protein